MIALVIILMWMGALAVIIAIMSFVAHAFDDDNKDGREWLVCIGTGTCLLVATVVFGATTACMCYIMDSLK